MINRVSLDADTVRKQGQMTKKSSRLSEILESMFLFGKLHPLALIWLSKQKKVPKFKWKSVIEGEPFDEEELKRQWHSVEEDLNPGIACGRVSGIIVVDADNPAAVQWVKDNLPPTPAMVITRHGVHFYYRHPGGERIGNRADILGAKQRWEYEACMAGFNVVFKPPKDDPKAFNDERKRVDKQRELANTEIERHPVIDLRGDGGQVAGPGATHPSGHVYEMVDTFTEAMWDTIPLFDSDWVDGLKWKKAGGPVTMDSLREGASEEIIRGKIEALTDDDKTKRARAWAKATPGAVTGEGGQIKSFYVACSLVNGFLIPQEDAFQIYIDWNTTCQPPWEPHDIARMVERAGLYGGENDGYKLVDRPEWTANQKLKPIMEKSVYDEDWDDDDDDDDEVTPKLRVVPPEDKDENDDGEEDATRRQRKLLRRYGIDYASIQSQNHTITQTPQGQFKFEPHTNNLVLALNNSSALRFNLHEDRLKSNIVINGDKLEDKHYLFVKAELDEMWGKDIAIDRVKNAIHFISGKNAVEPVTEFLDQLPAWDGKDHIRTMLTDVFGTQYTDLNYTMLRHWLTGMVARGIVPGTKFDTILILFGEQGAKKSQCVKLLTEGEEDLEWFTDEHFSLRKKDGSLIVSTHWVIEWSESEHAKTSERIDEVKSFLSKRIDTYRPVYERNLKVRPRRCVFIGTSNDRQMLHDASGNRRFYILPTADEMDYQLMIDIRIQVLAQALALFNRFQAAPHGGDEWKATKFWFEKYEDGERAQAMQEYASESVWDDDIENWVFDRAGKTWNPDDPKWVNEVAFSVTDVMDKAIEVGKERRNRKHELVIRQKLQSMGCGRVNDGKKTRVKGRSGRFWLPPKPPSDFTGTPDGYMFDDDEEF